MENHFYISLNNLRRRKLRAWLTIIGIFIGVAAVVGLISLGQGLQSAVEEQFQSLGKDLVIVQPADSSSGRGSASISLDSDDLETVKKSEGVEWAVGYLVKPVKASYGRETRIQTAIGVTPEGLKKAAELQGLEMLEGRSLREGQAGQIVVGYNHGEGEIWEEELFLEKDISIDGRDFEIVGRYDESGDPFNDNSVFLPKSSLRDITNSPEEESQILVKSRKGISVEQTKNNIEKDLRDLRDEEEGEETFEVQTSEQILESFNSIFGIVQAVLVGIAAISLLVGGIGIMNTMYTAVLERTKEIGTMKAVGAKNSDILSIFLIESGLLGLFGGVLGVLAGIGIGKAAAFFARNALGTDLLQAAFPWYLIVGALVFAFLVGGLSGAYPAYQASKLKPAEALRQE